MNVSRGIQLLMQKQSFAIVARQGGGQGVCCRQKRTELFQFLVQQVSTKQILTSRRARARHRDYCLEKASCAYTVSPLITQMASYSTRNIIKHNRVGTEWQKALATIRLRIVEKRFAHLFCLAERKGGHRRELLRRMGFPSSRLKSRFIVFLL